MLTSVSPVLSSVSEMKYSVLDEWMETRKSRKCWRLNEQEQRLERKERFALEYFSPLDVRAPDKYTPRVQIAFISARHNPYSAGF